MIESSRPVIARCPPLRQAQGTVLNTIMEDMREAQYSDVNGKERTSYPTTANVKLKLKTDGLPTSSNSSLTRLPSPVSAGTLSTCSDKEWQRQVEGFDDLYDATDSETEMSDDCLSSPSTRPTSLVTPITRSSTGSTGSRNRYPSLIIPTTTMWHANAPKSSPVPPTPPPKIPVSPAALSILAHSVPALNAPPSLDGSMSSDQMSNLTAPSTPDVHALPDVDWSSRDVHLRPALEENGNRDISNPDANSDVQSIEIAIENSDEDWRHILGSFPQIPSAARDSELPSLPLVEGSEPPREPTLSDRGLSLPEDALATLRRIPLNSTPNPWSETSEANDEMWQIDIPPERPKSADGITPVSDLSAYSFTNLSVPSPGGFFASLEPRARHTWSFPSGKNPPSTAVAEKFYNLPWNRGSSDIVEQVVECSEQPTTEEQLTATYCEDGPPTAIKIPTDAVPGRFEDPESPLSDDVDGVHEITRSSVAYEYDEYYEEELRNRALASRDRTSIWLDAQASYLAALNETNPVNEAGKEDDRTDVTAKDSPRSSSESTSKKFVRFAEVPSVEPGAVTETTTSHLSDVESDDSIHWRGFQFVLRHSSKLDSFLYRNTRYDAVQSMRLGLLNLHINCLLGKYELTLHERPPYRGPFSKAPRNSVVASVLAEKAQFSTLQKEQLVLAQLQEAMWALDALKYLNGGSLIASPASKRLGGKRRARVLDLGGHGACEWAWQLAYDYPNIEIYTVSTSPQAVNNGIKGPSNHRQISVSQLWKLPFGNNQFDIISARSLHALLKTEHPSGETMDEYDLCLKECRRCLKPGGYLEFFIMDAKIQRAGPVASAASIEFAFNLKTWGYDATPTKTFLPRLHKNRFIGLKQAWMFLPIGVEPAKPQPPRETPEPGLETQVCTHAYEAVQGPVGSTADVASVTGLFGGWVWEQWLLKLQMEMGWGSGRLLEGVGGVFDESRKNGAGWTCVTGWAMKPRLKRR